ncbi:MAG: serine hydrolase [Thermomicrobiales bacterium]|nr:serine hydrolase [Thermomicrobiales bacterium]
MLTRRQLMGTGVGVLLGTSGFRGVAQEASELKINSTRYISTNADTGAIFAQRNAHDQVAIASLTKIFTAMEAVSIAPLDTIITTTSDDMVSSEATIMGFGPGEQFTLEDLVYGMLLPSGNDAARAIARSLGYQEGDDAETAIDRFMDMVNQRVQDMGLRNTHLLNPDGWGVPGHYSSAADVAAFMAYTAGNAFVLKVMGTRSHTTSTGYQLTNTNKVLATAPSVIGGKTGYDDDAGWCLVQIAQRQSTRIIAVTLDGIAPDDWYDDNLVLLDYGFDQQTALGNNEFTGEVIAWTNPEAAVFQQAGIASASITGETTTDHRIVAVVDESPNIPDRVESENPSITVPGSGRTDGDRKGSGWIAGIGATALAGTMAATRWRDLGGEFSAASTREGLNAISASVRRAVPILTFKRGDELMNTEDEEAWEDDYDDDDTWDDHYLTELLPDGDDPEYRT